MKNKNNAQTLDDMLFENRNKDYGAYFLRKSYNRNLTKAMVIGVAPILLLFLSSFLIPKPIDKTPIEEEGVIINLEDWQETIPEPLKPKETTPALPIKTEKVATRVIPADVTPVEDTKPVQGILMPDEDELEHVAIGIENQDGKSAEGSFHNPGPIVLPGLMAKPPVVPEPIADKTFITSEIMPEFEGGLKKMYKWLGRSLKYPPQASNVGIEGMVIVSFIVEKDGQITEVKVLKGIGFGCDEEAERVINKMPKWKPGLQNGTPVRVRYTVPLNFQIN